METMKSILSKHVFFENLSDEYLDLLAGCASNAHFKAGAYLSREGDEANSFFLVRQGLVAVELHAPAGPITLYTHAAGDVLGWSWLFPPYRWVTSERAVESTRVIKLDGVCLRLKCAADPVFGMEFLKRFSEKMLSTLTATQLLLIDMYHVPVPAGRVE